MTRQSRLPLVKSPARKRARQHPEHTLQRAVCEWLRVAGVPGLIYFHPVNEGKRGVRSAARLKEIGLLAGASDLILVLPPDGRIAALELKAKGNKPTEAQGSFLDAVDAAGGYAACADNIDDALAWLRLWGALRVPAAAAEAAA